MKTSLADALAFVNANFPGKLVRPHIQNSDYRTWDDVDYGKKITVCVYYKIDERLEDVQIENEEGLPLVTCHLRINDPRYAGTMPEIPAEYYDDADDDSDAVILVEEIL